VLLTDSGGAVSAARRPVLGADAVARMAMGLARRGVGAEIRWAEVNALPGVLISLDGERVETVMTVTVDGERITAVHMTRNPDKLDRLTPRALSRR
jgi:RNA polymerase sigma-70 factor (ECF subfamily)